MNPHWLLMVFNLVSLIAIVINAWVTVFHIPHSPYRTVLLTNLVIGFLTRSAAITVVMVILGG